MREHGNLRCLLVVLFRRPVALFGGVGWLPVGAGVSVPVHLGAVTHLLADLLGHVLHDDAGDRVADLLGHLDTHPLRDLLLHVHRVLSAHRLGELLALLSRNIDRKILTSFIRNFFTLGSWHTFLHLLWYLFTMFFGNLKHE